MKYIFFLSITTALLFTACNNKDESASQDGLSALNADSLLLHIKQLSDDSFLGRKPFTEGETKTVAYLEAKFKAAGLEPGNGNSYLQEVPMVNIASTAAATMEVKGTKGSFTLKGYDDYVVWTDKTDSLVKLENSELVFAGYGVVAPEYNWNDYANLDVKGKVVLVLVNDPGFANNDTSLFKGKEMTYYGRWTYKFEEAARQGAKGCLIVHNETGASYPFKVVQNNWNASRLHLDNRQKPVNYCDVIGWVTTAAANQLLNAAGMDSNLLKKADARDFKAVPLGVNLSTSISVKATYNTSHNVIGKITGSKRPDEVIIYTAHWDHLGIGKKDEKGDSIYNGALDNATGTAGLLELARAFKSLTTKPERTIVFLSVTAEEQGLWGSAYYAQNPVYPAAKTACNINMDGLNPFAATKDIIVVGKGQNDLEDILREEATKMGRSITYEMHPEAGHYYRSDHFNFAKIGVPALYTGTGSTTEGKDSAIARLRGENYTKNNYHRPSDEVASDWTMEGGIADLKLLFLVGKRVAFGSGMPGWKAGSEFRLVKR